MSESIYERDMQIVQQHWRFFISLIKQDFNDLRLQYRNLDNEIKRMQKIIKIMHHCQDNVDFLLFHKDSIISYDDSLTKKFAILSAFRKRNNLDNAVAMRFFHEIVNSDSLNISLEQLNSLREKRDLLEDEISKIQDLINGISFDRQTIIEYSQKYDLNSKVQIALMIYPVFKASKKRIIKGQNDNVSGQEKLVDEAKTEVLLQVPSESEEIVSDVVNDAIEEVQSDNKAVVANYKTQYDFWMIVYNRILGDNKALLDKYHGLLQDMTPVEIELYNIYCSLGEDELKQQSFECGYEEAMAKIIALKLFNAKNDLDVFLKEIVDDNYSNIDDIELFSEIINELQLLIEELEELDKKREAVVESVQAISGPKVFFLLNEDMQPFASKAIEENSYQDSLLDIIERTQNTLIQKESQGVRFPKTISKVFEEIIGRTVFRIRDKKIATAFIRLDSVSELSEGGVMILTVLCGQSSSIQKTLEKFIRDYREEILNQLASLERGDERFIEWQDTIRKKLTSISENEEKGRRLN